MTLDLHARRFLERLRASAPRRVEGLSVIERREALGRLLSLGGEPPDVDAVEEHRAPGPEGALPFRLYTPHGAAQDVLPAIVYFHGGGLVAGSLDTYDGIARCLANASGCKVVAVGYRLAPEARFPAAINDASFASCWVLKHAAELAIDATRIAVCGDSAGATLAIAACRSVAAATNNRFALQILLCPILDYRPQRTARRFYDHGDLLDRETLEHDLVHYVDDWTDPADPRVSPLQAEDFFGLPPACIHTAECDPVREDGSDYAGKLEQAGVAVSYRCHPGMIHLFYGLGMVIPYVAQAYQAIGADIRARLS